jgi:hypothetical protein
MMMVFGGAPAGAVDLDAALARPADPTRIAAAEAAAAVSADDVAIVLWTSAPRRGPSRCRAPTTT